MDKDLKLEKEVMENGLQLSSTQCAHIVPASTNNKISGSNEGGAKVCLTYPLPSLSLIVVSLE